LKTLGSFDLGVFCFMCGSVRLDDRQGHQEESLSIGLKGKLPGFILKDPSLFIWLGSFYFRCCILFRTKEFVRVWEAW